MAFIQPCFIKKNTSELINKLIDLGYVKALFDEEYTKSEAYGLIIDQGDIVPLEHGLQEMELIFTYNFIDCGTNEELFLAIAALRDDSDINQWFIYNTINNTVGKFETIEWVLCKDNNICDYLNWDNCYKYCHKATVEEIIKHF